MSISSLTGDQWSRLIFLNVLKINVKIYFRKYITWFTKNQHFNLRNTLDTNILEIIISLLL